MADSSSRSVERVLAQWVRTGLPLGDSIEPPPALDAANWQRVADAADEQRLMPLLYQALKASGRSAEPPTHVRDRLRSAYAGTLAANWRAYQELEYLLTCFEQAGIPVVLLKGCALAISLYAEQGLRPFGDLDLLIPKSAVGDAHRLLLAQGYRTSLEVAEGFLRRVGQEQAYVGCVKYPAQIDLHWHLLGLPFYRTHIPIAWFWEHTQPITFNDSTARLFSPEAQLLHLTAHYALHHRATKLLSSYDIALLIARYHDQMNWETVIQAAKEFRLGQAVQRSLEKVEQDWSVAIPADAAEQLQAMHPSLAERVNVAFTLARRNDARVVLDAWYQPSLRTKFEFWLRQLFPSRAYMRARYQVGNARLLPLYYVRRLARGATKLHLSIFSVLANR